jgi:hypothetical protein
MVLDLAEHCFTNNAEDAPRAFEIGMLALTSKDVTSYPGIVLLETIHKLASRIVTFRGLSNGNEFHDAVHGGHQAKRGRGTAIIEFKLLTQHTKNCGWRTFASCFWISRRHAARWTELRHLRSWKGVELGQTSEPSSKRWDGDTLASKKAGFCSEPFDVGRGV